MVEVEYVRKEKFLEMKMISNHPYFRNMIKTSIWIRTEFQESN
jgi:hypothetical protein